MSVAVLNTFLQFPTDPPPALNSGALLMSFDNRLIDKNGNYPIDVTNAGTPVYPVGKFAQGLELADGNNYVAVGVAGDFAPVNDALLIEFYQRGTGFGFDSYIGQYDGMSGWTYRDNNGDVRFGYELNGAGSDISNNIGRNGSFELITIQYSNGNLSIWKDGTFIQTITSFNPSVFGKGQLTIGAVPLNSGFTSDNRLEIDELRIVPGFAPYTDGVSFAAPTTPFPVEEKPHRYWRVVFNAVSGGGGQVNAREVTFLETVGQITIGHTGNAFASSELSGANPASEAFDANQNLLSTWFSADAGMPQHVGIDLGAGNAISVIGVRYLGRDNLVNGTNMDVQFSDDGVEWLTKWSDSVVQHFEDSTPWISFDEVAVQQRMANGSFETGDTTGWTDGANVGGFSVATVDSGGNAPNKGTNLLDSASGGTKDIYQDFDMTSFAVNVDLGYVQYAMTGWGINWSGGDSDESRIQLEFLDSGNATLSTVTDSVTNSDGWHPMLLQGVLPVGTRTVRARIEAFLTAGGTANVSFDDIRLFIEEYPVDSVRVNAINRYAIVKPLPGIRVNTINRYAIVKPL